MYVGNLGLYLWGNIVYNLTLQHYIISSDAGLKYH